MKKQRRRPPKRPDPIVGLIAEDVLRAMVCDEVDNYRRRAAAVEQPATRAPTPNIIVQPGPATGSGPKFTVSVGEPNKRDEPTAYVDAGETRTTNATPPGKSFEPDDIEAALRRQPAQECPSAKKPTGQGVDASPAAEPQRTPSTVEPDWADGAAGVTWDGWQPAGDE
jgi:hypothetical protein